MTTCSLTNPGRVQKLKQAAAHARTLCQDLSQDVRCAACEAVLPPLTAALGPPLATQMLLDELLELVQVRHGLPGHGARFVFATAAWAGCRHTAAGRQ